MAQVFTNPTPEELRAWTEEMPEARISEYGNVNVQTTVLSRSAGSTYVVDRESSGKTMSRADYDAIAALQDAYIAEHDMIVIDGYIGNDPEMRTAARLVMEKRYANIAGHAAEAVLRAQRRRRADGAGHLHAGSGRRGLPRRPRDRRRPRCLRHARPQLRLLRGVEEGRPADVERHRLRQGRARPARRPQGDPDRRRREGLHDHRPVGHREDDDHLHDAERVPARSRTTSSG